MFKKILIGLVVVIVGIQFIPVDRSNPAVTKEIEVPPNVLSILKTSCYDCHSNETNWPWYSYVAPVSFLIVSDVNGGRKRLNFSEWDKYDEKRREKKVDGILEVIEEGEMPLPIYTFMHSDAKLDSSKIRLIKTWVTESKSNEMPLRYQHNQDDEE